MRAMGVNFVDTAAHRFLESRESTGKLVLLP
jgi:hypothetical protein